MSIRTLILINLLVMLLLPLGTNAATSSTVPGKMTGGIQTTHPEWFKESFLEIADDVEEAKDSGKHVILFMHLNNCPYCYKMTEENFTNAPHTQFIKDNFDVIVINIKGDRDIVFDEETSVTEKELADILKVRATPTIIFFDQENKPVARINGYRSVPAFRQALDYVQQKAYLKTSLAEYTRQHQKRSVYNFREHPQFKNITDLQSVSENPLALIFEDSGCDACNALYDGHLSDPEVNAVLKNYTVVRLDAGSEQPIIDIDGNKTTAGAYAEKLKLSYRPGIILFDKGKEITRIDGMLYRYHFTEMLRYVGERHHVKHPDSFFDYLGPRSESLLKSGRSIDLAK